MIYEDYSEDVDFSETSEAPSSCGGVCVKVAHQRDFEKALGRFNRLAEKSGVLREFREKSRRNTVRPARKQIRKRRSAQGTEESGSINPDLGEFLRNAELGCSKDMPEGREELEKSDSDNDYSCLNKNYDSEYAAKAKNAVVTAAVIRTADKYFLIVKDKHKSRPGFSAGSMEENETPPETAVRETREEMGLAITAREDDVFCFIPLKDKQDKSKTVFLAGVYVELPLNKYQAKKLVARGEELEDSNDAVRFLEEEDIDEKAAYEDFLPDHIKIWQEFKKFRDSR